MAVLSVAVLAHDNHHNGPEGWEWGMMALGIVFMLSIIALVAWLIWSGTRRGAERRRPSRAEEILAERYARGEISRDEYEQRLADLRR